VRVPFFGSRARREREFEEEIRAHLAMAAADHAARGSSPGESVRAARREFGNVTQVKELTREAWGAPWIGHLTLHLRLAVRSLRRTPGFVIAVVLTLALGIGATSTLFAIVDRLFLRPPTGLVEPDRLHRLYVKSTLTEDGLPALQGQFGYGDYLALADGLRSDGEVTAFSPPDSVGVSVAGEAQSVQAVYTSGNYFSLLGVRPQLGRFFSAEEERMGSPVLTAVISDGFWQRSFGGRRDVVGATVTIDGRQFTVVGIAPPGFVGADLNDADLWLPLPTYPQGPTRVGPNQTKPWYEASLPLLWFQAPLEVVARVRPGVTTNHLAAISTTVLRRSLGGEGGPSHWRPDSTAVALIGSITQALAPTLAGKTNAPTLLPRTDPSFGITWRLMAVVVVLLIIACLNVANLMLGRGMQRRQEIAARIALGASRRHLVGQILSECFVLSILAGLAAVAISIWGSATIKALLLPGAHWAGSVVDLRVLLFTGAVALVTCVVVALIPGLQISREDVARSLTMGRGTTGLAVVLRRALVISQSALSMVLLVGAGVFFRSLSRVHHIDVGYDVERLISGSVVFRDPQARYDDTWDHGEEIGLGLEQIAADLAREPSIQATAISLRSPMSSRLFTLSLNIPGRDTAQLGAAGLSGWPPITPASPTYFETTGIRLLKGRFFTDADRSGAPTDYFVKEPYRAAVISAAMAKAVWPNDDPIGKCFVIGIMPGCVPVVGVVTDAHVMDVVESQSMQYYVPLRPNGGNVLTIRVRPGQEAQASQLLWRALRRRFPSAEAPVVQSLADVITPQLRPWRMGASLFSGFGVLALIISFVGLYGLISYSVTQRSWELGLRLALGAQRAAIVSLVVREGLGFVAIGIAVGTLLSLLSGHAIAALLYETSPYDPRVLIGVALLLCGCAAVASFAPGWRAGRIDPAKALRAEG
jgi:predicted permease